MEVEILPPMGQYTVTGHWTPSVSSVALAGPTLALIGPYLVQGKECTSDRVLTKRDLGYLSKYFVLKCCHFSKIG